MSELAEAFEELLAAQNEARDEAVKVALDNVLYDAIVEALPSDHENAAGGTADSGIFKFTCRLSDFPEGRPADETPVVYQGTEIVVLAADVVNETMQITAGDMADE